MVNGVTSSEYNNVGEKNNALLKKIGEFREDIKSLQPY